jgi:parvulin-like peptidyl-prolyl isomerase
MSELSKIVIEQEEIVDFLKTEIEFKEVYQKILFQKVIHRTAYEKGIIITAEEIEAEADRQRREKRLERATDTLAWLADQLVSLQDWEAGIRNHLLAQKLAETLFAKEVERFFIQNRLEFEQIILYQMTVYEEKLAQELYYQIEEGEISFYDAAHLYDLDEKRRYQCGYEGKIYRFALQPNIAAILFSTPPKQLIGPIKTELGYHLFIVEELIPAELTAQRYQEILNNMFRQWLAVEVEFILQFS